ncbi:MAG: hypothetical protein HYX52_09605 [Chloroflexi bacterium]|nr:hypothetical protein [Chloroflexota bacterium]
MARKREPVDTTASQRLLQSKLKIFQGATARRSPLALDILTGRAPTPILDAESESEEPALETLRPAPDSVADGAATVRSSDARPEGSPPGKARKGLAGRAVLARTVYLSQRDLDDIDFIARAWKRRIAKRVSRSEVLRQAIGALRDAVELGAAPREAAHRRRGRAPDVIESEAHRG